MATIYSLLCWGGKDGKSVTASSTTDLITLTNHGLRNGTGVAFTSGTLPTVASGAALALNTTYYAKSISSSTFELYREVGLSTKIDFTSNGSSLVMKSAYYLGLSDKSRWTYGGTEYIFDSMSAWNTHRTSTVPASAEDAEVCEIGMSWDDIRTGDITLNIPSATTLVTTLVNGTRSDGYHNEAIGSGYNLKRTSGTGALLISSYDTVLDGFTVESTVNNGNGVQVTKSGSGCRKMIVIGGPSATSSYGVNLSNSGAFCYTSIVKSAFRGIVVAQNQIGIRAHSNFVTACGTGFAGVNGATTSINGFYYNNISIGNTTANWTSVTGLERAGYNAGDSDGAGGFTLGTPWDTITGTSVGMETTDFNNYAGGGATSTDYYPAAITSPQVETGLNYFGYETSDIADSVRPSYPGSAYNTAVTAGSFVAGLSYTIASAGTTDFTLIGAANSNVGTTFKATGAGTGTGTATLNAKVDIGPFEYDLGYGDWPIVRSIDFTGLVSGSQVIVYTTNTTTELARNNNTGTTYSYDLAADVTVDYTILKAGYAPIRVTGLVISAEANPVAIQQDLDRAYVTPSGLTFGTNVIVNVTNRVVTSLQVTTATTVQNWYSYLMDSWIASSTNTTLKNVAFPVIPFGEASFTTINGIEFSDGATSISKFSRDGFRYSSDAGATATAIWAAILTLNTGAGIQVKYRQSPSGTIVNAANTGPMDQLVQVYGDASHGNFDYRGHMVLRAPKPGYSQPKPDLVATYGNMLDGLFVAALEPVLQYATTDADIDAANLVLNNTTKTFTITAAHTMLELYQRAQWWANQDAQWDADIPLTTTNGGTFTQPSNWSMIGVANVTGGTLAGGSATLAAGTQGIAYSGVTLNLGAAGTYTFTASTCTISATPTGPSTYSFSSGVFNGTMDLRNTTAHAITMELPTGASYTTANNTGGTITVTFPVNVANVSITSMPNAGAVPTRLQLINQTALTAAQRANSTAYSLGDIRLRQTGVGTENTAGLYLRCTTAGTSAGSPPVWNTTPGGTTTDGTAVWTTYKVLFYDDDPASTSYSTTYTEGNEFLAGETVEIRFAEMNGATSFKTYHSSAIVSASGFSFSVSVDTDAVYATNALNGADYESTFSPNFTSDYIVLDSNTDFSGKAAYAYFCYTLTTSNGMYEFWDGVTALDEGNYRINVDVLNLYFDESAGFVKQTDDVRIFRSDGTRPALDPTTGGAGIEINWRVPVNVVTTGGSALTAQESAHLLGLTNAPSAATVSAQVWTDVPAVLDANMVQTVGTDLQGDGTETNKFRSILVP